MSSTPSGRRRGRPPVHSPDLITRLLAERDRTGESFAALSHRSGIPAGTLSGHARRSRRDAPPVSAPFVELRPVANRSVDPSAPGHELRIALDTERRPVEIHVPADFSPAALRRVLDVLEAHAERP